jgi:hypothetical protein
MLNKFVFNILNKCTWQIFFFIFFNEKKGLQASSLIHPHALRLHGI